MALRAVDDFKFPKIALTYGFNAEINPETQVPYGYYFVNQDVGQKEINVILARMKMYWVEFQISQERMFENNYYDRDIRLHSQGNVVDKLTKMLQEFTRKAERAEFDYGRVSPFGQPVLGEINDE